MRLDQALQAPQTVTVNNERWSVPPFTLDDFVQLGRLVDEDRQNALTKGMRPDQRLQVLSFYRSPPATFDDLQRIVYSPLGVRHICTVCFGRATVIERDGKPVNPPEPVKNAAAVVAKATIASLHNLAVVLADMNDAQQPATAAEETEQASGNDPLPGGPPPGSTP